MSGFVKPQGVCFLFGGELPATILSKVLCKITNFLQDVAPYVKLQKYDDWWEHDGLHFHRKTVDFDALFQMINSPKNLLESTPDNDEESNLVGSCAVILPQPLADKFRVGVLQRLNEQAEERNSEAYYQEVVL